MVARAIEFSVSPVESETRWRLIERPVVVTGRAWIAVDSGDIAPSPGAAKRKPGASRALAASRTPRGGPSGSRGGRELRNARNGLRGDPRVDGPVDGRRAPCIPVIHSANRDSRLLESLFNG
ncbi:hypothetical protein GCM10010964_19800 [Caldovatus sediminis]|uniref:Uncharacterized protein n=1 Tax=Caldovatus sediminis TaxID=2041189 RepID=A0A8J2ZAX9_9PROT|nr:hypothetical protein GCM10010964_19800 [Caldovatus sediminis]